jgi:undecaprenyl pyrophosphate synthase
LIDASSSSLNLAKQQVYYGLDRLTQFSNQMDTKYPEYGFKAFTTRLSILGNTVQSASGPCFSTADIEEIENFSRHLAFSQDFVSHYFHRRGFFEKLQTFWNLRQAIIDTGKATNIIVWRCETEDLTSSDLYEISNSIRRAFQVKKITDYIEQAILDNQQSKILSLTSILLALVIRVEAHEYEIENMIKKAKKYTKLNFDIQEILSVTSKVAKGDRWKSDSRAIRDAISHAKFSITQIKKGHILSFSNNEQGYNFVKNFTKSQMMLFYQDFDRLAVIQNLLLNSALITDFISKEFKK